MRRSPSSHEASRPCARDVWVRGGNLGWPNTAPRACNKGVPGGEGLVSEKGTEWGTRVLGRRGERACCDQEAGWDSGADEEDRCALGGGRTRATVTWQTPVRAHDVSAKREHASEEVQLSVCLVNRTFSRSDGGPGGRHSWLTCTRHPKTCVLARTHLPSAAYGGGSMNMTASRPFDQPTAIYSKGREWPGDLLERPRRAPREPHHEAKVDRCNRSVEMDWELCY